MRNNRCGQQLRFHDLAMECLVSRISTLICQKASHISTTYQVSQHQHQHHLHNVELSAHSHPKRQRHPYASNPIHIHTLHFTSPPSPPLDYSTSKSSGGI